MGGRRPVPTVIKATQLTLRHLLCASTAATSRTVASGRRHTSVEVNRTVTQPKLANRRSRSWSACSWAADEWYPKPSVSKATCSAKAAKSALATTRAPSPGRPRSSRISAMTRSSMPGSRWRRLRSAVSSCARFSTCATSQIVRHAAPTGRPSTFRRTPSACRLRQTSIPGLRGSRNGAGTVIQTLDDMGESRRHNAAALRWLRYAEGPAQSSAARARTRDSAGVVAAMKTLGCSGRHMPLRKRPSTVASGQPSRRRSSRVNTPSCRPAQRANASSGCMAESVHQVLIPAR